MSSRWKSCKVSKQAVGNFKMVYAKTYILVLDKYEAALAKEREQANQATLDFQQKEQTMKGTNLYPTGGSFGILHDLFL